jgi:DNA ligase-1
VVTFQYQELTELGVPRFPSYIGLRQDAGGPTMPTATPVAPAGKKKATASVPAARAADRPERVRRFELVEGTSGKFWEVWVTGNEMTTRSGKIGNQGRKTLKRFPDAAAARKAADKLITEKTGNGYVEK